SQCHGRNARWRKAPAESGTNPRVFRCSEIGRAYHDCGHRKWHQAHSSAPHIRAVLYHQERPWHRTRPLVGLRHRAKTRRMDTCCQPHEFGQQWNRVCRVSARVPGNGKLPGGVELPCSSLRLHFLGLLTSCRHSRKAFFRCSCHPTRFGEPKSQTICYKRPMRLQQYAPRPAHLKWLLDSDPAIRWQVMRDLTYEAPNAIADERSRVATEGWGGQLLARQSRTGNWGGPSEDRGLLTTLYSLVVLMDLGLDPASKQARIMIE